MAYQYKDLGTFDGVVSVYNSITPIRCNATNKNLPQFIDRRPLGERRYWWERVIKVNDNCYILSDGSWMSSNVDFNLATAPIIWERRPDGDFITIRNNLNSSSGYARYWFLERHLPLSMRFWFANGKHFVKYKGEDHYLPKSECDIDWQSYKVTFRRECKVVFKCEADGTFTRANELQPQKTRRINKPLDTEYKPKVAALWEWMQVMLPVLGVNVGQARQTYTKQLCGDEYGYYWAWDKKITPEEVRAIIDDEEHPKRLALGVLLANDIRATNMGMFEVREGATKALRDRIRRVAGLYEVVYK